MHPLDFVESVIKAHREVVQAQLSVYKYHPESLLDERIVHRVGPAELRSTYERLSNDLREDEDIAFDSLVKVGSGDRHFALVDFEIDEMESVEKTAEVLISEYRAPRATLVNSGRSFHLYLAVLLSRQEWVRFMGRLLLLNARGEQPTVDPRWIGHRLLGGFSALRWSANHHPCVPKVVREWAERRLATR